MKNLLANGEKCGAWLRRWQLKSRCRPKEADNVAAVDDVAAAITIAALKSKILV